MKRILILAMVLCTYWTAFAQLNVSLVSNYTYNVESNDIWGYVAPDGTEYALVGVNNGVSIINLSNPANPVENAFIPGQSSTWRDLKTWGNYAYVTADEGNQGLLIIDLSNLPNSVTYEYEVLTVSPQGQTEQITRCHNLYIDENGYMYLAGSTANQGGNIIYDVHTTPGTPIYKGATVARYSHDSYARGDTLWSSDINDGFFSVFDVTDKTNPVEMATQTTPSFFTHNAWISDDNNTLFTTDERADAFIGAYDVSDLNDIEEIGRFKPKATIGTGVIPHNVHVWNDYLLISYYTDGFILVDAARPDNMIEVGNYDSFLPNEGGFSGAWGAYPFLPSGLVLLSDINTGLYVLQPTFMRACYLEGVVTDANNNNALNDVEITVTNAAEINSNTNTSGVYKTGTATAGSYDITFYKFGYLPQTLTNVSLTNGVVTELDVALQTAPQFSISAEVTSGGVGIPNAEVVLVASEATFENTTGANGTVALNIVGGTYEVFAGKWGYISESMMVNVDGSTGTITIELEEGYQDGFAIDLGWTIESNASTGIWERAESIGIEIGGGNYSTPNVDVEGDLGNMCYVTGNGGSSVGENDIDDGGTILTSPVFDATGYINPHVEYHTWFSNFGGQQGNNPNDMMVVKLDNGSEVVTIETIDNPLYSWVASDIAIADFITPTATMKIIFDIADDDPGHVVEGAVDFFKVTGDEVSANPLEAATLSATASPNPFMGSTTVSYEVMDNAKKDIRLVVYNILGQQVETQILKDAAGTITLGEDLNTGVYFIRLENGEATGQTLKIVKQ